MYGYRCEYCEGTVQPRTVTREAFKHKDGFIILVVEIKAKEYWKDYAKRENINY